MAVNAPALSEFERIIKKTPALIPQYVDREARYVAPSWTEFRVEYTIHRWSDGQAECSCKGFSFTGHCRHLELLEHAIQIRKARDVVQIRPDAYTAEAIAQRIPGFLRSA